MAGNGTASVRASDAGCDRRRLLTESCCQPRKGAGTAGGVLLAFQPGESDQAESGRGQHSAPGQGHQRSQHRPIISDEELIKAVRAETRAHDYDEVILATGRQSRTRLARGLHLDPIHQLRRRWGQRLVIFPPGPVTKPDQRQQN